MSDFAYYQDMEHEAEMEYIIRTGRNKMKKRLNMFFTDMTKHYEPACIIMGQKYGDEMLKCPECSKNLRVYYWDDECYCSTHYCNHCFIKFEIGPYIVQDDYDNISDSIINQASQEELPF